MERIPSPALARESVTIRNSRLAIAALLGSAFVGIACVPSFVFLGIAEIADSTRGFDADTVLAVAGDAVAAFYSGTTALRLWRWSRRLLISVVTLRSDGVHLRFNNAEGPRESFLAWADIVRVERRRAASAGSPTSVCIVGSNGAEISFSSSSFLRSHAVARRIAAAAGLAVEEVA